MACLLRLPIQGKQKQRNKARQDKVKELCCVWLQASKQASNGGTTTQSQQERKKQKRRITQKASVLLGCAPFKFPAVRRSEFEKFTTICIVVHHCSNSQIKQVATYDTQRCRFAPKTVCEKFVCWLIKEVREGKEGERESAGNHGNNAAGKARQPGGRFPVTTCC